MSNHDLPDVDWQDSLRDPLLASEHPPLHQHSAPLRPDHHQDGTQQQHLAADPQHPGADALHNEQGPPYEPPPEAYYEDADATAAAADAQGAVRDEELGPREGVPQILEQVCLVSLPLIALVI